jgi:hypothetical protein
VAVRSHMEVVIIHTQEAASHMQVAADHMLVAVDHMLVAADQIQVKRVGRHRRLHLHHNRLGPFVVIHMVMVVRKQLELNLVGRFEEAFIQGIEQDIQVDSVADQVVHRKLVVVHRMLGVLYQEGIKMEGNSGLVRCCYDDFLTIYLKAKQCDEFRQQ